MRFCPWSAVTLIPVSLVGVAALFASDVGVRSDQKGPQNKPLSVSVSLRSQTLEQYDPVWVGVEIRNRTAVAVRVGLYESYLSIERRLREGAPGKPEVWKSIRAFKEPGVLSGGGCEKFPSRVSIKAGGSCWVQYRIIDQRIIGTPGVYRVAFRAPGAFKIKMGLVSPWVQVTVRRNEINHRIIGDPGKERPTPSWWAYMTVLTSGAPVERSAAFARNLGFSKSEFDKRSGIARRKADWEWMKRQPFSQVLRDQILLFRVRGGITAAMGPGAKVDRRLLQQADAELAAVNMTKYKCPTGGLGGEILWARAAIAIALGDKKKHTWLCQDIDRRYPGADASPSARAYRKMK